MRIKAGKEAKTRKWEVAARSNFLRSCAQVRRSARQSYLFELSKIRTNSRVNGASYQRSCPLKKKKKKRRIIPPGDINENNNARAWNRFPRSRFITIINRYYIRTVVGGSCMKLVLAACVRTFVKWRNRHFFPAARVEQRRKILMPRARERKRLCNYTSTNV